MLDSHEPSLADVLAWHQGICPRCVRGGKCSEWWEIIDEFRGPEVYFIPSAVV